MLTLVTLTFGPPRGAVHYQMYPCTYHVLYIPLSCKLTTYAAEFVQFYHLNILLLLLCLLLIYY